MGGTGGGTGGVVGGDGGWPGSGGSAMLDAARGDRKGGGGTSSGSGDGGGGSTADTGASARGGSGGLIGIDTGGLGGADGRHADSGAAGDVTSGGQGSDATDGAINGGDSVGEVGGARPDVGRPADGSSQGPLIISPQAVDLGDVLVGASTQLTLTVTAVQRVIDLSVIVSSADLRVDPVSTCVAYLAADTTCKIVVDFSSKIPGETSDVIVVNAAGRTVTVRVQAIVQMPASLVVVPSNVEFVSALNAASSPVAFGIGNAGGVATGLLKVALSGTGAALFTITDNKCGNPLSAGGTCTLVVTFAPQLADGGTSLPANMIANLTATDLGPGASVASARLTGLLTVP